MPSLGFSIPPSLGFAILQALPATGMAGVKQAAALQKSLSKAAGSLGDTAVSGMYGAGVNAAKGLVKGLKGMSAEISTSMRRIAEALVSQIRGELGNH